MEKTCKKCHEEVCEKCGGGCNCKECSCDKE
jgi:hypothetical protein